MGFGNNLTLEKNAKPLAAALYVPAEPPMEKLRLSSIAVLTYMRACRPPPQAPQQPGRKRWDRLRARLAQVVDALRAQQADEAPEADRAGERPRRDGIAVISTTARREHTRREDRESNYHKQTKRANDDCSETRHVFAELDARVRQGQRGAAETSWGGIITLTHFLKTPFGVRPGLGPASVFSRREWCYYLILSYLIYI